MVVALALAPALAWAHERWVKQVYRAFDREYFRHMTGEVLRFSLGAAMAVAGVVAAWYLVAVPLAEKLALHTPEQRERAAKQGPLLRRGRALLSFFLDADVEHPWMEKGERIAVLVFARLPAAVLLLGVVQGWLLMPSFPLSGPMAPILKGVAVVLALWVLWGRFLPQLGIVMLGVFLFLIYEYRLASIDAIPVLASAFFYLFARDPRVINARQIAGVRVALGVGFFMLGLINKIYHAELFISVGDAFPELIESAQRAFPWMTRESWSFCTALGEMVFGLLLLLGLFDKLTTFALSAIFANFMITFGFDEIVHVYPIAGFAILFFHAPPGTLLDGAVFRTHVKLWHWSSHSASPALFPLAVGLVAVATGALLMFGPLYLFVDLIPRLGG